MNRVVLVTGGGGIQQGVAARFPAAGDTVIITGRNPERLAAAAAELDVRLIACDAADPGQVAELAAELVEHLDVLVNIAGGNTDLQRAGEAADLEQMQDTWRANLDDNLLSAVLTTTAVLDKLRPGGTIINVGSIGAEYAYLLRRGEGGAGGLERQRPARADRPEGPDGQPDRSGLHRGTEFFHGQLSEQRRMALIEATLNGRPGPPSDIAEAAYFLASESTSHITGQTLHVNGGAHTTR
ncbi:SDR family NAD(P)-dependent oxidoreductase [Saccharopolyspora sp. NPDC000995]